MQLPRGAKVSALLRLSAALLLGASSLHAQQVEASSAERESTPGAPLTVIPRCRAAEVTLVPPERATVSRTFRVVGACRLPLSTWGVLALSTTKPVS